jgi:acetyl esterase/lipase
VSYELDPELVPAMAALAGQAAAAPAPPRGDWKALRQAGEVGQAYLATLVPPSSGVQTATFHATTGDGASIELRWYTKTSQAGAEPASQLVAGPGPAVVYAHGGGMVLGTLDLYDELISWYVDRTASPSCPSGTGAHRTRAPARHWPRTSSPAWPGCSPTPASSASTLPG